MLHTRFSFGLLVGCLLTVSNVSAGPTDWPGWRGPNGDGHSSETGLPSTWNRNQLKWRKALPGSGQSSPVVWGNRVFLTTALGDGREREILCIDRNSHKLLWQKTVWRGAPERIHKMNSWATPTCTTDGERVYAFFGRGGGLFCYTVDGKPVWHVDLGQFTSPWGTAASPVLVGNLVIQNCDADENAYLIGLDKGTGRVRWKVKRDNHRGWSTPVLAQTNGHAELVLNGHSGPRAYNPETGEELWRCKSFNGRGSPTATPGFGNVYLVNGLRGDFYAVKLGGRGDVTAERMVWHTPRGGGRDLPSPILIDRYLLVTNMKGVLTTYDAETGRKLSRLRLGGNFSASPVAWGGQAYFLAESGETVVVRPGKQTHIVARNKIPTTGREIFRASIAPSRGEIFLRSNNGLYCIGNKPNSKATAGN